MSEMNGYIMTISDIHELIALKIKLDELTTKVMMSQCRKICSYDKCQKEEN